MDSNIILQDAGAVPKRLGDGRVFNISGRVAAVICIALIIIGFCAFAPLLDRYPEPYFDDAFLNYPAVRQFDGLPFEWPASASAPFGTEVWAYHGPLFPHLQVITMCLLGPSQFACRIPQLLAGFSAIGILCGLLIQYGYRLSSIALPLIWMGDRALMEILYGRMEGLALLCVVVCFVSSIKAVRLNKLWLFAASGLGL